MLTTLKYRSLASRSTSLVAVPPSHLVSHSQDTTPPPTQESWSASTEAPAAQTTVVVPTPFPDQLSLAALVTTTHSQPPPPPAHRPLVAATTDLVLLSTDSAVVSAGLAQPLALRDDALPMALTTPSVSPKRTTIGFDTIGGIGKCLRLLVVLVAVSHICK